MTEAELNRDEIERRKKGLQIIPSGSFVDRINSET